MKGKVGRGQKGGYLGQFEVYHRFKSLQSVQQKDLLERVVQLHFRFSKSNDMQPDHIPCYFQRNTSNKLTIGKQLQRCKNCY